MIWHSTDISEVLEELKTGENGLPNGVAEQRLVHYGENVIVNEKQPSFLQRLWEQLRRKTVIALFFTALISFTVSFVYKQATPTPFYIILLVLLNAFYGAWYAHRCDKALEKVKKATLPSVRVCREGIERTVSSALLVPGDIVLLEEGDYVSADARILSSTELRMNELVITGDEIPVEKDAAAEVADIDGIEKRKNMVFSGTSVAHGTAKVVVVATGLQTEKGHAAAISQQTKKQALPLERELSGINKLADIFIFIICALFFFTAIIQNFASPEPFADMTAKTLLQALVLGFAAIPDALPAIATLVVAVGIERFIAEKIILKDPAVAEKLSKTDIICADKTGVLTRNKMQLSKIYDGDKITDMVNGKPDQKTSLVLQFAALCSTLENDSTEDAIKNAFLERNGSFAITAEDIFPKLAVIPFDHDRKTMTVITMIKEQPYAIVKGAPESLVPNCTECDGDAILKINDDFANDALRIVCIAMRKLETIPANPTAEEIEKDLTFVGLLGLDDPPRETVVENIRVLKKAGIRTLMITGDHLITATAVARRIGVLTDGTSAISGEELAAMDEETLQANIEQYSVFARVAPGDKLRIVRALKNAGHTVTITGDSVQDADAIAEADVGCATGRYGADVARGNADVVIGHNRFDHILYAIKESRGLFVNIRKTAAYLLSCNFASLIALWVGLLIFKTMPVTAEALLLIHLLIDGISVMALSTQGEKEEIPDQKQGGTISRLISLRMGIVFAIQTLFIAVITLIAYSLGNQTMAFAVLGLSQILHGLNCKSEKSLLNRRITADSFMNICFAAAAIILVVLLFIPLGSIVFGLKALTFPQFMTCIGLSVLILPFGEAVKAIVRLTQK